MPTERLATECPIRSPSNDFKASVEQMNAFPGFCVSSPPFVEPEPYFFGNMRCKMSEIPCHLVTNHIDLEVVFVDFRVGYGPFDLDSLVVCSVDIEFVFWQTIYFLDLV
jgi:hypothetical protein